MATSALYEWERGVWQNSDDVLYEDPPVLLTPQVSMVRMRGRWDGFYELRGLGRSMRIHEELIRGIVEHCVFDPHWPQVCQEGVVARVKCDDKNDDSWLQVLIAGDGDVHVSMQEVHGQRIFDAMPSVRIRTLIGGGRMSRTRQALLWLWAAVKLDTEVNRESR